MQHGHCHGGRATYALIGATVAALLAGAPARADATHEQQLEQRVAQLEKLVADLAARTPAAPAAPAAAAAAAPSAAPAPAAPSSTPNAAPGTRFVYTGYLKADALWTDTGGGVITEGTPGRDFYLPGGTPVGAAAKSANMDFHVKQTRLILGTDTPLGDKADLLSTRVEFDFFGTSLGNQRSTNTWSPTLRHAFVQWRHWLVGQTWSNFQDTAVLVDSVDYIGATDGTVFVRQPQVRYTNGGWSLSAENRQTTLTPFHGGTQVVSDDGVLPDLTVRYTFKGSFGQVSGAVLGRQLRYRQLGGTPNDAIETFAASVSAKLNLGKDDLRAMVSAGNLGRYVGLNFSNDAVIDGTGHFHAISGFAGYVAYRHLWSPSLRSSLYYAVERYTDDRALTGVDANRASQSWTANLIYTPLPKLELGAEYRHGSRELVSGKSGDIDRLQLTTKFSF